MQRKEYEYKRVEDGTGTAITTDVFYQKDSSPGGAQTVTRKPIVIMLHGGGFVVGSKDMVPIIQIQTLVQEFGFVAVVPNYRLCPTVSLYQGPVTDTRDCFDWIREELPGLLQQDANVLVQPEEVVAMGYSAGGTLGLLLGSLPNPPRAILAFYPGCFFTDPFWHSPLTSFSHIPTFPPEFLEKIYDEGTVPSSASIFLEQPPHSSGPPQFDLSRPRAAWLLSGLKEGWGMEKMVADGDYARVDPVTSFSSSFPPTCFIHGTADTMIDVRFSKQAHGRLVQLGVESKLSLVEGQNHGFDGRLVDTSHALFASVREGLAFLADQVRGNTRVHETET